MTGHLNPDGTVNLDVEPEDPTARTMAIVNCGLCDDDGYRGGFVCDHRDHTAEAGRAVMRAELEKIQQRKAARARGVDA